MRLIDGEQTPRSPRLNGWVMVVAFGVVFTIAIAVIAAVRAEPSPEQGTSDFRDFWNTARAFRDTGEIRSDLGVHNYLPFFVIFMLPWTVLPLQAAVAVFTVLSLGTFVLTVVLTQLLLHGRVGSQPRPATLVAMGLMLPYVVSCGVVGQVNLLVLFLVLAAWFLVERGREWEAGLVSYEILPLEQN